MAVLNVLFQIIIFTLIGLSKTRGQYLIENVNTTEYDPELLLSQILGYNITSTRQSGSGLVTFEGQNEDTYYNNEIHQTDSHVRFEDQTSNSDKSPENSAVSFQDPLEIPQNNPDFIENHKKKKRRRRRKPRLQNLNGQYGLQQHPGVVQIGGRPDVNKPLAGFGPQYRPYRKRKVPNLADDALASVTSALGSIAQYDDYQCVPRLLCEVAGGRGPSSQTSSILPSFIDLQPLTTLLAAYNGLSSSPLFTFGRAVFLGVTSKGNTGTCRYAYPLCPTDPDKLVDYLNNHNGGFFRFFNGGQPQNVPGFSGQQNLQQFYSQLLNAGINPQGVNQNYGLNQYPTQQNYGFHNPDSNPNSQNYGFGQSNYGLYRPELGGLQYSKTNRQYDGYGSKYPYQKNPNQINLNNKLEANKIEKRIQNKAEIVYVNTKSETKEDSKWIFPERNDNVNNKNNRVTKSLRFPNEIPEYIPYDEQKRKGKGFLFPGVQSNRQYVDYYNYPPLTQIPTDNGEKIKFDKEGYYYDNELINNEFNDDGVEIVYVLRGNGDPNNPEVVKLKPGQRIE